MVDRKTAPTYTNHEHCQHCYSVKCSSKLYPPQKDCPVITCAQNCGFRFHACKLEEHRLTCPNEKVNCINYSNGCPILLQRSQLGRHLETCPASVVYCTMEWNRWPVYSEERKARVPFKQNNIHARYGQLDVALALRDQTVLNESRKVPRKTRQALRNNLTARFPAVPIQVKHEQDSHDSCDTESTLTISDEEGDAPWDVSRNPPGLQSSVCNKLFKATKCATESLAAALSVVTESDLSSKKLGDKTEDGKSNFDKAQDLQSEDESAETQKASSQGMQLDSQEYKDLYNEVECKDIFDSTCISNSDELGSEQTPGNVSDISNDNIVNGEGYSQWTSEIACDIYSSCMNEAYLPMDLNNHLSNEEVTEDCSTYLAPASPPAPPPAPPPPFSLNQILALDLNLESITRYQAKPLSMYTFLCAQQFRRDEYGWHFKNVHGDIHGGLSGWLEQRCPMATYGCTYSVRRLHPNECGSQIVYSPIVHSFGIKPAISKELNCLLTPEKNLVNMSQTVKNQLHKQKEFGEDTVHIRKESTPEIYTSKDYKAEIMVNGNRGLSPAKGSEGTLTSLPVEVIRHIASFLDNFSINHLALTCNLLRDVCCSLLEDRGMVIEEWERKKVGHQFKWTIAYKRWCFSSAFTPVEKWGFEENTHMSEHLKTCMFRGQVEHRTEPYPVPGMECTHMHSANFWDVMQRMGISAQMETGPCICPQVETVKEKDDAFTACYVKHII